MRVVSLLPSATEIVFALGRGDDLVGVTFECDFPPDTIAVDPDHWRSGVGRALMHHATAELAAEFDSAILWTVAGYERGQRFYTAMGWAPDGGVRADGTEVSFRRRLDD